MSILDFILLFLLVVVTVLALRKCIRDKKRGKGCLGNCAACGGCGSHQKGNQL